MSIWGDQQMVGCVYWLLQKENAEVDEYLKKMEFHFKEKARLVSILWGQDALILYGIGACTKMQALIMRGFVVFGVCV